MTGMTTSRLSALFRDSKHTHTPTHAHINTYTHTHTGCLEVVRQVSQQLHRLAAGVLIARECNRMLVCAHLELCDAASGVDKTVIRSGWNLEGIQHI